MRHKTTTITNICPSNTIIHMYNHSQFSNNKKGGNCSSVLTNAGIPCPELELTYHPRTDYWLCTSWPVREAGVWCTVHYTQAANG